MSDSDEVVEGRVVGKNEKTGALGRLLADELLAVVKAGINRSGWKSGDRPDKVLRAVAGEAVATLYRRVGLDMPPSEEEVREKVAQELRAAARRHPAGGAKRAAFLEAADEAERGPR